MNWHGVVDCIFAAAMAAAAVVLGYTNWKVWAAHKRVLASQQEYVAALHRAKLMIEADPHFFENMSEMDRKRRLDS